MQFYGRERELEILEQTNHTDQFECTVLYGRRRIGKTLLLRKFMEDKDALYFMALQTGEKMNLECLSEVFNRYNKDSSGRLYPSFSSVFDELTRLAKNRRFVFVIDEFPYLAENYPVISPLLQKYIDHEWKETRLHLILCGSSMSFMEKQILGAKSPLYGRRTSLIKLEPFRFNETEMMLAGMKREDIAVLHASLGGVAEYLSFVNPKKSLRENLIHLFFSKHGRMYVEPENLLNQELREPGLYHQILDAMANGASKNSEIATKVRMESGGIGKYLDSLIELGIIKKEAPFEGKSQRKSIYRISDGCYRFWYRFVNKNKSAIELGLGEDVYDERVKDELSDFMGYGFEQVAFDIIDELSYQKKLPGVVFNRGRWWGNNKKARREEEIDYVGRTGEGMTFAEIKWRSDKMNSSALKSLIEKSMLIDAPKRDYILVSKSGFTNELKKEAQKAGVVLYRFDKGILE